MSFAERVYRAALAAYPAEYRAGRGDEVLGTLLEANEGHRLPDLREVGAIVVDGYLRGVRTAPSGVVRASAPWAAYALAALTAAVAMVGLLREGRLAGSLPPGLAPDLHAFGIATDLWFAAFAGTAVATLLALAASVRRTAIMLAIAGVAVQAWEVAFPPAAQLPGAGGHFAVYAWTDISTVPREPWHWLVPSLILLGCTVLSAPAGRPRTGTVAARIAAALTLVGGLTVAMDQWSGGAAGLIFVLLPVALLALAMSVFDPRPALACLPLVVTALPLAWTYSVADPTTPAANGTFVAGAVAVTGLSLCIAGEASARRLRGRSGTHR
jgi:hypothetical protein